MTTSSFFLLPFSFLNLMKRKEENMVAQQRKKKLVF